MVTKRSDNTFDSLCCSSEDIRRIGSSSYMAQDAFAPPLNVVWSDLISGCIQAHSDLYHSIDHLWLDHSGMDVDTWSELWLSEALATTLHSTHSYSLVFSHFQSPRPYWISAGPHTAAMRQIQTVFPWGGLSAPSGPLGLRHSSLKLMWAPMEEVSRHVAYCIRW